MTANERAKQYCALIALTQERMEHGATMAFDRHHPHQRAACARMLRYLRLIRWLYGRALLCDQKTTLLYRAACLGKPWPKGGIDDGDETYFRFIASGQYEDVTGEYACHA